jgi:hypothetical protein
MATSSEPEGSRAGVDPAERRDRLGAPPAGARRAARAMQERLGAIVEEFIVRLASNPEVQEWVSADRFPRGNSAADIGRELAALAEGALPRSCPDEVATSAAIAVATGFPLSAALQCYRTGHEVQWEAWVEAVRQLGVPPEEQRALLEWGSRFMFEYADRCSWWIERAYQRERQSRLERANRERLAAIRSVLAGASTPSTDVGYDFGSVHTAFIATGPGAEAIFDAVGSVFGGAPFAVEVEPGRWWAWAPTATPEQRAGLTTLPIPEGAMLAVGGPASGVAGFRTSHREAELALNIARRRPAAPAIFRDEPLVALALADEGLAAGFVDRELGVLADASADMAKLRDTLEAYFACAQNAASTAALMGIHERTVANRLRAIEERLGVRLAARRAELGVALDLYRLLHPKADSLAPFAESAKSGVPS